MYTSADLQGTYLRVNFYRLSSAERVFDQQLRGSIHCHQSFPRDRGLWSPSRLHTGEALEFGAAGLCRAVADVGWDIHQQRESPAWWLRSNACAWLWEQGGLSRFPIDRPGNQSRPDGHHKHTAVQQWVLWSDAELGSHQQGPRDCGGSQGWW